MLVSFLCMDRGKKKDAITDNSYILTELAIFCFERECSYILIDSPGINIFPSCSSSNSKNLFGSCLIGGNVLK